MDYDLITNPCSADGPGDEGWQDTAHTGGSAGNVASSSLSYVVKRHLGDAYSSTMEFRGRFHKNTKHKSSHICKFFCDIKSDSAHFCSILPEVILNICKFSFIQKVGSTVRLRSRNKAFES